MAFNRYVGIDYSGAETPTASLKGLRVYLAEGDAAPVEVPPPPSPRKYWTRKGIAEWLVERLAEDVPTLVGIDHGFSFPLRYFEAHRAVSPTGRPSSTISSATGRPTRITPMSISCATASLGNGAARMGNARWRRLTEERAGGAKSVFHFDVQGSVAKSTHAGIPWLRFIRQQLGARVHFWPFDGWDIPAGRSAIAEVYPALWRAASPARAAPATSTTPSASPPGCRAPIATAALRPSSTPIFHRPNARWRRWRAGYWAFPA